MIVEGVPAMALVLELGSHSTRAGLSSESHPRTITPSISFWLPGSGAKPVDNVTAFFPLRDAEVLPLWHGGATADAAKLRKARAAQISSIAETLKVSLDLVPVLIVQPRWFTSNDRQELASLLTVDLNVPAFFFTNQAVCTSLSLGLPSAVVLDLGEWATTVCVVSDAYVLKQSVSHRSLGGAHITDKVLESVLLDSGEPLMYSSTIPGSRFPGLEAAESYRKFSVQLLAEEIKRNYAFSGPDLGGSQSKAGEDDNEQPSYLLPSGTALSVGREKRAAWIDSIVQVASELLTEAFKKSDPDLQHSVPCVVTGGACQSASVWSLLQTAVAQRDARFLDPKRQLMRAPPCAPWVGGALICHSSCFSAMWIPAAEFKKDPSILHQRIDREL